MNAPGIEVIDMVADAVTDVVTRDQVAKFNAPLLAQWEERTRSYEVRDQAFQVVARFESPHLAYAFVDLVNWLHEALADDTPSG